MVLKSVNFANGLTTVTIPLNGKAERVCVLQAATWLHGGATRFTLAYLVEYGEEAKLTLIGQVFDRLQQRDELGATLVADDLLHKTVAAVGAAGGRQRHRRRAPARGRRRRRPGAGARRRRSLPSP